MGSLSRGQTVFRSTPPSATPSHTARPEAACMWLANPLSQEVLRALNHVALEQKGALDLF